MMYSSRFDPNGLHRLAKNGTTFWFLRNLIFVTEQPSSVEIVRASRFENSAVEPRYTTGFSNYLENWNPKLDSYTKWTNF